METTINKIALSIPPLVIVSTWLAKTIRPGSLADIKNPKINPAIITMYNLFVFAKDTPVMLPSGVTAVSTPIKNNVSPTIIRIEPIINLVINSIPIGTIVRFNIITIIVIGATA